MVATDVRVAETRDDVEAVRQLCRDFVAWLLEAYPDMRDKIMVYFEPGKWERTLADLPVIHSRPKGAMLLARVDGVPAGCIMYHEMSPGVAEVKRLFVPTDMRGLGVASKLVDKLVVRARADGYTKLRLDSTRFLTEAVALYRHKGFRDSDHAIDLPADFQDVVVYMQRDL